MLEDDLRGKFLTRIHQEKRELATELRNTYFTAILKALARFPGLISERNQSYHSEIRQVYEEWSAQPFRYEEKFSESNPLAKLFDDLCAKKTGKGKKAKSMSIRRERLGQDNDGNEVEGGLGEGLIIGAEVEAEHEVGMSLGNCIDFSGLWM
jgi:hypothetical protein